MTAVGRPLPARADATAESERTAPRIKQCMRYGSEHERAALACDERRTARLQCSRYALLFDAHQIAACVTDGLFEIGLRRSEPPFSER